VGGVSVSKDSLKGQNMAANIVNPAEWRKQALAGEAVQKTLLRKVFSASEIRSVKGEDNTFNFVISTDSIDRMGDTVAVDGWQVENFFKGGPGPVLWAHDYTTPPVGRAPRVAVEEGALIGTVEFVPRDVSPFAGMIRDMVEGGFIKSTSVGFDPIRFEVNEERGGLDFKEQELLEFSIVPVPANPQAVIQAKAAGIDVEPMAQWAVEALEIGSCGDLRVVPLSKLKATVRALGYGRGIRFFDLSESEIREKVKRKIGEPDGEPVFAESELVELMRDGYTFCCSDGHFLSVSPQEQAEFADAIDEAVDALKNSEIEPNPDAVIVVNEAAERALAEEPESKIVGADESELLAEVFDELDQLSDRVERVEDVIDNRATEDIVAFKNIEREQIDTDDTLLTGDREYFKRCVIAEVRKSLPEIVKDVKRTLTSMTGRIYS
jgi:HK97 family phage prohead protease